ncbi:hypothetical protein RFI_15447 [Reticulomyxa filosa]|uniref:Uncharacterized protein n=1 Tax=Reticulomyxa filosa TaxID=46433 RepID=X6N636_RETFI|nr:hypothetical protein RFI_15447 [Reticulomyxa filosa]|eukprot:ETO21755.1 hypothetical protein RFI_15447 [Reticulomyxa filosa]
MTDAGDKHCSKSRSLMNLQVGDRYLSGSENSASWNELKPTAQQLMSNVNANRLNSNHATDTISIRAHTHTRTDTDKTRRSHSVEDDYDWKSVEEIARDDNTIPRRYNADLYDHDGFINDRLDKTYSLRGVNGLPDAIDEVEGEEEEASVGSDKNKVTKGKSRPSAHGVLGLSSGSKEVLAQQQSSFQKDTGQMATSDHNNARQTSSQITLNISSGRDDATNSYAAPGNDNQSVHSNEDGYLSQQTSLHSCHTVLDILNETNSSLLIVDDKQQVSILLYIF